ncbi:biotin-dependent carboxyltransferase family protein [Colwellia echini]|uniref:Biotin-dependent carboxyltransferase n=1 Tax=Colwellia echini TaxID=1982103 RepID=A0ABY3MU35_9GAMM|nr:biotin-dependent carboxyltransferase family protein [Colwellia echini]TYK64695.1 biotin-dependent carboxyltransferase [Colwellia echini]
MLGFVVKNSGVLSIIQDAGRFGAFNLGLTNGGPADALAFNWANKLCGNELNSSAIEISVGGLQLTAQVDCVIAITGAPMPLTLNGKAKELWQSFTVKAGDNIQLGFASVGVRCYLAVAGGFTVPHIFGSSATVCRESIGGINGGKLVVNDLLVCQQMSTVSCKNIKLWQLPEYDIPTYSNEVVLKTVLGYQHQHFSVAEKQLFFSSEYKIGKLWDRMGYRLQGRPITADIDGILSEGISYGAIQIPADGQPIVLLNDRQTIGGYPKMGTVFSADCAKLSQYRQGDSVRFKPISIENANNLYHLNAARFNRIKLIRCN